MPKQKKSRIRGRAVVVAINDRAHAQEIAAARPPALIPQVAFYCDLHACG
jgi:hypothetical protein